MSENVKVRKAAKPSPKPDIPRSKKIAPKKPKSNGVDESSNRNLFSHQHEDFEKTEATNVVEPSRITDKSLKDEAKNEASAGKMANLARDNDEDQPGTIEDSSDDWGMLTVGLSKALHRKIAQQAKDEGLKIGEYIHELLSEGVVIRAWEIIERKNQMKSQSQVGNRNPVGSHPRNNNSNSSSNTNNHHNNQRKGTHGRSGMSHMRYQSIMDDKATFLEYVRNQERNRR